MGEIYEREGRPEEALAKYQLLIDTYMVRNEPQRAIDVYYRLIELSPDTINARSRLAELLKNDGRIEEAAEQIGQVAATYFRMGQTNKALEEYRRGVQWAPNNATLRAQYGQALLKLERYEAALGEFRRALELQPGRSAGIARLNMTLALMGDQPPPIWQSLATLLEQLKTPAAAALGACRPSIARRCWWPTSRCCTTSLASSSRAPGSTHRRCWSLSRPSRCWKRARTRCCRRCWSTRPWPTAISRSARPTRRWSSSRKARPSPGSDNVDPASRYPFSTPLSQGDLVRRMAEAYAASGDMAGAEQALQEAKQHLPYDRAIYTKLADIYFQQGKLNEALAQLDELATHYESRQDLDRAIETLEYGMQLAPNNIPLGSRLAKLLYPARLPR